MKSALSVLLLLFSFSFKLQAQEDKSPAGQAHWMLERLTGIHWPLGNSVETQMAGKIASGDSVGAAGIATSQPQFLNVVVKQMALKLSTHEETVRIPLNDFVASFIGVTRDESDARELIYGNFYYMADATKIPTGVTIPADPVKDLLSSNNHYAAIDTAGLDIGAVLKRVDGQQIVLNTTAGAANATKANPDPAGVLTLHSWMSAHAIAGTNRRMVEYTFREFMCLPLINWADTSAPDVRVGRDVDRFPGGDNNRYQTTCKGCHSQQDGFRGAFAKWDYNATAGVAAYAGSGATGGAAPAVDTGGRVVMKKMNQNGTVWPDGYLTTDDTWLNHAMRGQNATTFGWRGPAPDGNGSSEGGHGANGFGRLVANSQRFSQCMARHVFESVCRYSLSDADAQALYTSLGQTFEQNKYDLKKLFQSVAVHPKCRM